MILSVSEAPTTHTPTSVRRRFLRSLRWVVIGAVLLWSLAALMLVAARWIDPPTTAVHIQRSWQAWMNHKPYLKRYKFVPLSQISPNLQHAVIAAEDAHFYQHHGFDWQEIQVAAQEDLEGERTRGASTITQQLIKNLFFGTGRSILRCGTRALSVIGRYWSACATSLRPGASAASSYVRPVDDAAESFVVGVVVAPDDVPADHAGLLLMAGVVGAVEREVAQRRELCLDAV